MATSRWRPDAGERAARAERLAAGLAHAIRNPLNAAGLQVELLRSRARSGAIAREACAATLDVLACEMGRIDALVTDYLAFARPHRPDRRPVDLARIFRDVVREAAPPPSVRVRGDIRDLPPLAADSDRLRRALLNLVRNAVEAMPDGGTLTLRARRARGAVEVRVEDTGVGVPADARVFEAFYTTKPSGTGLGLAIVQRVVEDHGGQVRLVSAPGRTVFTLRLPDGRDAGVGEFMHGPGDPEFIRS